jgi:hypothetical protein
METTEVFMINVQRVETQFVVVNDVSPVVFVLEWVPHKIKHQIVDISRAL